ncbi:UNVERIFIED_CONTAM: putative LRR receptor-like serine/threonine-protein kinase [Sesamum angustifolium]|uniref:LRR receptor-like serine/threonine-protein kinase n=1 Tax=Sesamum angustifolium TaxID=2727405 RepID=A0AAW2KY90_9LAMI
MAVRALREIARRLGKKDWDFSKDPCSGEGNWTVALTRKGFESNVTCDCTFDQSSTCHVVSMYVFTFFSQHHPPPPPNKNQEAKRKRFKIGVKGGKFLFDGLKCGHGVWYWEKYSSMAGVVGELSRAMG